MKFIEKIFSVKDEYKSIFKAKIITILGIRIKFKQIDKQKLLKRLNKNEHSYKELQTIQKQLETHNKLLNIISSPAKCPKARGCLREHQMAMLGIMKVIKKLCNENNLSYWLDYGTLLGAVRHKGFIPWDGDTDICMLREDYLKIIPLLKEYYSNSDEFFVREIYKCKNNTLNLQLRICNKGSGRYGVDIFPVDRYFKGNLDKKEFENINSLAHDARKTFNRECIENNFFQENLTVLRLLINQISKEIILKNNVCACNSKDNPSLFYGLDFDFSTLYPKLSFNYNTIFPLKTLLFEEEQFFVPNNTEELLNLHYGQNYMMFPKKFNTDEDRINEYMRELQ